MKKILTIICITSVTFANAQVKKTVTKKTVALKTSTPFFKNSTDSFSYAIGLEGASYYKSQGAATVNSAMIKRAFDDVYGKKTLLLTPEQSTQCIQTKLMAAMNSKSSVVKEEGKKFLAENKKRHGVVELPNGLQYEIIKQGTGEKPKITDTVKAHYAGRLINGTEDFDNSYKRGQPLEIPVGRVIQGWVQALQLMPVGSKWKLFIPSDLGYGDRGSGAIPGGATLIFEIELIEIVNRTK